MCRRLAVLVRLEAKHVCGLHIRLLWGFGARRFDWWQTLLHTIAWWLQQYSYRVLYLFYSGVRLTRVWQPQYSLGLPWGVYNQNSTLVFFSKCQTTAYRTILPVYGTFDEISYWEHVKGTTKPKGGLRILSRYTSFWQKYDICLHFQNVQRTCLMYHAASKVEFQPFNRSYSQLTFFNFL